MTDQSTRTRRLLQGLLRAPPMKTVGMRFLSRLPLLVRLPWGGWWLAWNDVMSRHVLLRDGFEQGEQHFLLRFLQPGMIAFDLGAHHGFYTLLASKRVGAKGRVIAFEPSPRELRRLRWNLVLNRCRNVSIEPFALGNIEGMTQLFVCLGRETGCNSLRLPPVSEPVGKVQVPITSIDRYLQTTRLEKVDFVKVDVEGAELEVLNGAYVLLNVLRPLIICEMVDVRTEPWGYHSREIYEALATRGYQWFSITPGGQLQPCPKKERFHENLLGVPEEKLGLITTFVEGFGKQCIE